MIRTGQTTHYENTQLYFLKKFSRLEVVLIWLEE